MTQRVDSHVRVAVPSRSRRILGMIGLAATLLLAVEIASAVMLWQLIRLPALVLWAGLTLVGFVAPLLVGYGLGRRAGRLYGWEALVAGIVGLSAALVIWEVSYRFAVAPGWTAMPFGRAWDYAEFLLSRIFRTRTAWAIVFLAVGVGAGLGRRATPSPRLGSRRWSAVGAGILAMALVAPLAPVVARLGSGVGHPDASEGALPAEESQARLEAARKAVLELMQQQEIHYSYHDYRYAGDIEELDVRPEGYVVRITWADEHGWSGSVWEEGAEGVFCSVHVGEVPESHRARHDGREAAPGFPACHLGGESP